MTFISCFLLASAYHGAGGQLMDTPSSFGIRFQIRTSNHLISKVEVDSHYKVKNIFGGRSYTFL